MERLTVKGFKFTKDYVKRNIDAWSIAQCLKKLQKYEDAEENGMLIHIPCRVGDTVYCLTSARTKFVECKVLWIEIHGNGVIVFSLDGGLGDVVLTHLGKKWFTTREDAEQALAKMEGVKG